MLFQRGIPMKTKKSSKYKTNNQPGDMVKESATSYHPVLAEEGSLPYSSFEVINFRCFENLNALKSLSFKV
jgi:hypothetical protein